MKRAWGEMRVWKDSTRTSSGIVTTSNCSQLNKSVLKAREMPNERQSITDVRELVVKTEDVTELFRTDLCFQRTFVGKLALQV